MRLIKEKSAVSRGFYDKRYTLSFGDNKKQGYFLMPETVRVSAENDSLFKMISDILSKRYNTVKSFDKPVLSVVSDPSLRGHGKRAPVQNGIKQLCL